MSNILYKIKQFKIDHPVRDHIVLSEEEVFELARETQWAQYHTFNIKKRNYPEGKSIGRFKKLDIVETRTHKSDLEENYEEIK